MSAPPSRLSDTGAPEGSFPLSHSLSWHNGMHVQAPQAGGADLPARAIADGTVVFVGKPTAPNTNVDAPQNYNPFDRPGVKTAAWTDNGCIIIEHRTTIGAAGTTETEVVFYSLYMHLSVLGKTTPDGQATKRVWQAGDSIWRKDEVGTPGKIYGHGGQIHFEVCLDVANLRCLIGRAPNWVAPASLPVPTADGRTDSIFGSLYFYLSANAPTDAGVTRPAAGIRQSGGPTLGSPLWVKMSYVQGACQFESYNECGDLVGNTPMMADVEYDLYKEATERHNALTATQQATSSPSGWYELLRFGRNIGHGPAAADKDPLPVDAAHWRRIVGPAGTQLWADLNAQGSCKFSDADFLPAMGWNCIDDDTSPNDQRCDSEHIKSLICDPDPTNAHRMDMSELSKRLGDTDVQKKLKRAICKFPTEWDKASITSRYAFVMEYDSFKLNPQAWTNLEAHLNAISFDGLPAGYLAADWRMHPREFVERLRACGWLSAKELAQCIPRKAVEQTRNSLGQTVYPQSAIAWPTALTRASSFSINLGIVFRKYLIDNSKLRIAYFLANAIQETIYFSRKSELGGSGTAYAPWYGRGLLQLTWEDNYRHYGNFRGWQGQSTASFRDSLEADNSRATDSAGYYWITCAKVGQAAHNISRDADANPVVATTALANVCSNYNYQNKSCNVSSTSIDYHSSPQSERVARAINTGNPNSTGTVNGLIPRNNVLANTLNVLVELADLVTPKQRP
jgi:predicted chitinase